MNHAQLKKWSVGNSGDDYTPPEMRLPILQGTVFNHPNHEEGKFVKSSQIQGKTADGKVVTKNTVYELGEIDPDYEEAYPDARNRLMDSLPTVDPL